MIAVYATSLFRESRAEDVAFIAIHLTLVFVSIYALARESVPHVIAIGLARFLSFVWAIGRLIYTFAIEGPLIALTFAANCGTVDTFFGQGFFGRRHLFEALLAGFSLVSVVIEAFVAYQLCRIYSERPYRVVQVPSNVRKMYKLVLGFSVATQLCGLMLGLAVALFTDLLLNTYVSTLVGGHAPLYGIFLAILSIVLPVWSAVGWFSLRREWRQMATAYLVTGLFVLTLCGSVIDSAIFRWTFRTWWFFATTYILSVTLAITCMILAVMCRMSFGKGLAPYLRIQTMLSNSNFPHDHFEKDASLDKGRVPTLLAPTKRYSLEAHPDCSSFKHDASREP